MIHIYKLKGLIFFCLKSKVTLQVISTAREISKSELKAWL